jgi:hypothetical protein
MRAHDGLPQDPDPNECSVPLADVAFAAVERALRDAVGQVPGASYLDVTALACPDGRCAAWVDGQLAFRDTQHLNAGFAASRAPGLGSLLAPLMMTPVPTPD